jgi:D-arabinose 1-dehydrogenase-like Zn-dependent alcohol dehydrogenase
MCDNKNKCCEDFRGAIVDCKEKSHGVAWASFDQTSNIEKVFLKHPDLKPNEIRIKVLFSGICQSDITMIKNKYKHTMYPAICGHEIVGEIYEAGSDVESKDGLKI